MRQAEGKGRPRPAQTLCSAVHHALAAGSVAAARGPGELPRAGQESPDLGILPTPWTLQLIELCLKSRPPYAPYAPELLVGCSSG